MRAAKSRIAGWFGHVANEEQSSTISGLVFYSLPTPLFVNSGLGTKLESGNQVSHTVALIRLGFSHVLLNSLSIIKDDRTLRVIVAIAKDNFKMTLSNY